MTLQSLLESSEKIRIAFVRNAVAEPSLVEGIIRQTMDMELVGIAQGAEPGLELVRSRSPEIVLVENIPELVDFTGAVKALPSKAEVILLAEGRNPAVVQRVVDALAAGAFDVVPSLDSSETVSHLLLSKIRCCSIKRYSRQAHMGTRGRAPASLPAHKAVPTPVPGHGKSRFEAVLVGVSTGGPEALMELLPALPKSFPVPIVIVLHMPKEFTGAMAAALDKKCELQVSEAKDGDLPVAGHVYLAAGGRHCLLERGPAHALRIRLGDGPPECGCKPSADVLFRTGAQALGGKAVAVILTGMGNDGTRGLALMQQSGSAILAQDELSSVVWGMPGSAVKAGLAEEVLPLARIAQRLTELTGGS